MEAARDRIVPDVVASGLSVLFCGINPGLMTAATGHHFARPGNRFWPVLHLSGFTPRQLAPAEQEELLSYGLGITNVAARATARADELSAQEYRDGGRLLTAKVERLRPRWLAVVGVTAYRSAFANRRDTQSYTRGLTCGYDKAPPTLPAAREWTGPSPPERAGSLTATPGPCRPSVNRLGDPAHGSVVGRQSQ